MVFYLSISTLSIPYLSGEFYRHIYQTFNKIKILLNVVEHLTGAVKLPSLSFWKMSFQVSICIFVNTTYSCVSRVQSGMTLLYSLCYKVDPYLTIKLISLSLIIIERIISFPSIIRLILLSLIAVFSNVSSSAPVGTIIVPFSLPPI